MNKKLRKDILTAIGILVGVVVVMVLIGLLA